MLTFRDARDPPSRTLTNGSEKSRRSDHTAVPQKPETADKESIILDISARTISMPPPEHVAEPELVQPASRPETPPQTPNLDKKSEVFLPPGLERSSIIRPEVISLDDYELSDSDRESVVEQQQPRLRRLAKKLPLRKDLEIAHRQARESVKSLGVATRSSVASYGQLLEDSDAPAEERSSEPIGNGVILEWQVNMFVDNLSEEDGPGDAEAALRRLEGQIDLNQQRVRESRVDGWLETVRTRQSTRLGRNGAPLFDNKGNPLTPTDDSDNEFEIDHDSRRSPSFRSVASAHRRSQSEQVASRTPAWDSQSDRDTLLVASDQETAPYEDAEAHTPQSFHNDDSEVNFAVSPDSLGDAKAQEHPRKLSLPTSLTPAMRLGDGPAPQRRRSFVLQYRSDDIARHWIVQDREIFNLIKFEELLANQNDWMMSAAEPQVLDWTVFTKERIKLKTAHSKDPNVKAPSPVWEARLRFNIMVKFIASEILLSPAADRVTLMNKFVRVAWVRYCILLPFHLLTSVIEMLRHAWLQHAGRDHDRSPNTMGDEIDWANDVTTRHLGNKNLRGSSFLHIPIRQFQIHSRGDRCFVKSSSARQ